MIRSLAFAAALLFIAVPALRAADPDAALLAAEEQRMAAIAKGVKPSVCVFARGGAGGGSGVVISPDGYALTNFHVVKPCGNYMKCSMADGRLYDAVLVGIDPVGDVAVIKLLGRDDFPPAEMADSDEVRVGDWCFAVGNPFLLATDFQPTVTFGLVSGTHRYQPGAGTLLEYTDCLQTDASINPGNSGGPLFDSEGRLIGINGRGSFEKRGRVNVGVGYAISINQIKNFMGHLKSGRIVDHATLGAQARTDDEGKVVVSSILETSDAFRRGLGYGNEIVAFGGRPIRTTNAFKNVLGIFPKGWRVPLSYRKDGKPHDTHVRLAGVHSTSELIDKVEGKEPGRPIDGPNPPGPRDPRQPRPMPMPKPEDKPADKPEEKPAEPKPAEPKPPMPGPMPMQVPFKEPLPDHVAKLFKAKSGFANYHFNEINRDRVWTAFSTHGDFSKLTGDWRLVGQIEGGGDVEIVLGAKQLTWRAPNAAADVDLARDLDDQLVPQGSGGLLAALHLWRRLLVAGPAKIGDCQYVGTLPLVGRKGLFDALSAAAGGVETHFYFDPATGELAGLECFADATGDPCEIYFSDYRDVAGRKVPHRLVAIHGEDVFAVLQLKQIVTPAAAE